MAFLISEIVNCESHAHTPSQDDEDGEEEEEEFFADFQPVVQKKNGQNE